MYIYHIHGVPCGLHEELVDCMHGELDFSWKLEGGMTIMLSFSRLLLMWGLIESSRTLTVLAGIAFCTEARR